MSPAIKYGIPMTGLSFALVIIATSRPGSSLFSWHPTLMALGFLFLIPTGILLYTPHALASPKNRTAVHWGVMFSAGICAVLGFAAIYMNKIRLGKDHFTTLHGKTGLAAVIGMMLLSVLPSMVEMSVLVFSSTESFRPHRKIAEKIRSKSFTTLAHRTMATGFYCVGLFTVFTGLNTGVFTSNFGYPEQVLAKVLVCAFGLAALAQYARVIPSYKKHPE
eukprot:m.299194 g.299194  ORF g.299194 m.299194 type:complete len:220 (-) comp20105_c0_seq1:2293-2952(-)